MPHDTTSVPLGPLQVSTSAEASLPPLAMPCMIDGHDARSCPECGRTFRMKPVFGGKTIRCRGCKSTFRVGASDVTVAEQSRSEGSAAAPPPGRSWKPPPRPQPAAPVASRPPTIFEDIGDLLDELRPGEEVASVVRPRRSGQRADLVESPLATLIAVILGGACAIPIVLILLRLISPTQFDLVAGLLLDFLSAWVR